MSPLTSQDIDAICDLVYDLCGISWDDSKSYLIESRLRSLLDRHGCGNYGDFARQVRATITPSLAADLIDAVTTRETRWFRDPSAFDALKYKIIPSVIDSKAGTQFPKRIRIWSAACSTGQEAYSLAMALAEIIPEVAMWDVQVTGTDISPTAIAQASRGAYSQLEIDRGLNPQRVAQHFAREQGEWRVRDEIRSLCNFAVHNLHEPFKGLGPFDVIFCRNVAIYFNDQDRRNVFERMAAALSPEGWILAASTESLADLGSRWICETHCRANCYRPRALAPSIAPAPTAQLSPLSSAPSAAGCSGRSENSPVVRNSNS